MEHLDHELLEQYRTGTTTPAIGEKVEAHLNSCQECKERYNRWQIFQTAIRDREAPQHSESFVSAVMTRIAPSEEQVCQEKSFSSAISSFFRNWGMQSFATACSLLLVFSYSFDSQSLDTNAVVFSSFESEILSYGYSDETFHLSKVLGYSDLEESK
jgi:anti-sigma factor RsiW